MTTTDKTPDPDELRRLLERATAGPWVASFFYGAATLIETTFGATPIALTAIEARTSARATQENDAALIVAAVNALPSLLSDLQAVREENERLKAELASLKGCVYDD